MNTLRCLLVDDEPPALAVLRTYIAGTEGLRVIGECHTAMDAKARLEVSEVDLLFLDIHMPGITGIDLLRKASLSTPVIFTTAHRDYAYEGFELNAVDYLLKPISYERFLRAVQKVRPLHVDEQTPATSIQDRFIYLRVDRKMVKVYLKDIHYIEAIKDYLRVHTSLGVLLTRQTISHMEDLLPSDLFIRIHRSFIVSFSKIEEHGNDRIKVGKQILPIGVTYRPALRDKQPLL